MQKPHEIIAPGMVRHMGRGELPTLMMHCMLANSRSWRRMAAQLDDLLDMQAFDLPGHGNGPQWDETVEYQLQTVQLAKSVMQGQKMDVIGHSFGGTAALRLAIEAPAMVRRLVLIEPVLFAAARDGTDQNERLLREEQSLCGPHFARGDYASAAAAFFALWGEGPQIWAKLPEFKRAAIAKQMRYVEAAGETIFFDRPGIISDHRLEKITQPILLIECENSPPIIKAINKGLMARLPYIRREKIAGAGHLAPMTHPEKCAELIREFLG